MASHPASSSGRRRRRALVAATVIVGLSLGVAPLAATARLAPAPSRWTVLGHAPALPPGSTVLGAVDPSRVLSLEIALRPRDPTGLTRFVGAVTSPRSTSYRHFLRRGEFANRFGPTVGSVAMVVHSLRHLGLRVGTVGSDRMTVRVTAPARIVEQAFGTPIESVRLPGGRTTFANTRAPRLARNLGSMISGIGGLADLMRAVPAGLHAVAISSSARATGQIASPSISAPTECASASNAISYFASHYGATVHGSTQLAGSYNLGPLYAASTFGAGVSVAVYELESNTTQASDIALFKSCYGLTNSVTTVSVDGGATDASGGETQLDIETIMELAPAASIVVYRGPNADPGAYDTYARIVANDTEKVISTSWGECEPGLGLTGATGATAENTLFAEAAANGQTVLAASGDSGSNACYSPSNGSNDTELATLDPASQPYVTAVGGTTLSSSATFPPAESAWSSSGGGISREWPMPSYQSTAPASLHVTNTYTGTANSTASTNQQIGCASPPGPCREVPDVSAVADPNTGYLVLFQSAWQDFGGTSGAAPLWAAIVALADSSTACTGGVGLANPALYAMASTSLRTSVFNDVTTGSNDPGNESGRYPATSGYDMATGLGTPNAGVLVPLLCAPIIDALSPTAAVVGATVTVRGVDLLGVNSVSVGGMSAVPLSKAADGTSLTLTVPSGVPSTSTIDLVAHSSLSSSPSVDQARLTIGTPVISGISASTGATGSSLTISGTGLFNASAVLFGTSQATFTVTNDSTIVATVPPGASEAVDVTAINAVGSSAPTASDRFTYGPPSVTAVSPSTAGQSGGTSVTISGSTFVGATSVQFGSIPATTFTVNNDQTITAIVPPQTSGTVDVTVVDAVGSSLVTAADHFTYTASPVASSISAVTTTTASPPVVSAGASSVTSNTPTVAAGGSTKATITVTLRTAAGIGVADRLVTLHPSLRSSTVRAVDATTNAAGKATFLVSDRKTERVTYVAIDTTDGITLAGSAHVTFVAPAHVAVDRSIVTASLPTRSCGGSGPHATVTVTLIASDKGPVPGRTVTVAVAGHASSAPVSATTSTSGLATFVIKDRSAEHVRASIRDLTDGVTLPSTVLAFRAHC